MNRPIRAVAVGVPARDEEHRIGACLGSLVEAAAELDVPVCIGVAADDCSDDTAGVAAHVLEEAATDRLHGVVVVTSHRSAGAARAAAIEAALEGLRAPAESVWVATTDADTIVDRTWLSTHLSWARRGLDGVAGLVDVSWEPGSDELPTRYLESIASGGTSRGHGHLHGANLGFLAARWRAVGGCGAAEVGEDHHLWQRLRADGARLLGVDDLLVTTSGRLVGRAPGGFADYLARLVDGHSR